MSVRDSLSRLFKARNQRIGRVAGVARVPAARMLADVPTVVLPPTQPAYAGMRPNIKALNRNDGRHSAARQAVGL